MIRPLLAALLATALLAVSLPAVDHAERERSAARTGATAATLAERIDRFAARNDPVAPSLPGASRVVSVGLPRGVTVRIDDAVRWRAGGRSGEVRTDPPLDTPGGTLELRGGEHRLALGHVRCPDGPVVTLRRFKSDGAATPSRVPERPLPDVCV